MPCGWMLPLTVMASRPSALAEPVTRVGTSALAAVGAVEMSAQTKTGVRRSAAREAGRMMFRRHKEEARLIGLCDVTHAHQSQTSERVVHGAAHHFLGTVLGEGLKTWS